MGEFQLSTRARKWERGKQISGHDWGDLSQFLFFRHDGFCMRTIEPSLRNSWCFSLAPADPGAKVPKYLIPFCRPPAPFDWPRPFLWSPAKAEV